jgi:hypothetical protein
MAFQPQTSMNERQVAAFAIPTRIRIRLFRSPQKLASSSASGCGARPSRVEGRAPTRGRTPESAPAGAPVIWHVAANSSEYWRDARRAEPDHECDDNPDERGLQGVAAGPPQRDPDPSTCSWEFRMGHVCKVVASLYAGGQALTTSAFPGRAYCGIGAGAGGLPAPIARAARLAQPVDARRGAPRWLLPATDSSAKKKYA